MPVARPAAGDLAPTRHDLADSIPARLAARDDPRRALSHLGFRREAEPCSHPARVEHPPAGATLMRQRTLRARFRFASIAALLAAGGGTASANELPAESSASPDEIAQLKATVERLTTRVNELERADGEQWLSEERAAQIRSVVTDVLADAETRSNFRSDAALAGYEPGKGFFLQSADGNYSLRFAGQIQFRYTLNHAGDQRTEYGFQLRRTRLTFEGHIIDPSWTYKIQAAFGRGSNIPLAVNTSDFFVEDAWVEKDFGDGLSMRIGQFRSPWLQEDLVSSRRQLAVERSLLAGYFQQNFNRGIQLEWETDRFRLRAWTGNGIRSPFAPLSSTVVSSNWNTDPTAYSFIGRAEVKFGDATWLEFEDFNSFRGGGTGVMLGVSGLYQRYDRAFVGGRADATVVSGITGDITVNFGGASLFAYGVWESGEDSTTFVGDDPLGTQNPWGFLVQGGYFLSDDLEAFARYEYGVLGASGRGPSDGMLVPYTDNRLNLLTVGFNWFIRRNDLKFTFDWGVNLDTLGLPAYGPIGYGSNPGAGYRTDLPGQELQWSLRAQMQLLF
jgi:hypothetical protein